MTDQFLKIAREYLKAGMASAFTETGLLDLIKRVRSSTVGPRVQIFGFHRVVDAIDWDSPVNPSLCVTTASFRKQMEHVRDHFQVLSLADAMRAIDGQLYLERDAVALTFDDGYLDVYTRAMPILRELRLPATVFVPTSYPVSGDYLPHDRLFAAFQRALREGIDLTDAPLPLPLRGWVDRAMNAARDDGPGAGIELLIAELRAHQLVVIANGFERLTGGTPKLDPGARVMTPAEIHTLAEAGWEIGAHTMDHAVLTREPAQLLGDERRRPREDIARWTGRPARYFAYCNGYHSRPLVEALRRAGYEGAVTTFDRPNQAGGDIFRASRKCLWDGHTRGPDGQFSAAVTVAHLHDLFGDLGLTRPVDGEVSADQEVIACAP
jgi:peptidoglycan/xylan/chitin deacetylase (PgdA/CDA1 family)